MLWFVYSVEPDDKLCEKWYFTFCVIDVSLIRKIMNKEFWQKQGVNTKIHGHESSILSSRPHSF